MQLAAIKRCKAADRCPAGTIENGKKCPFGIKPDLGRLVVDRPKPVKSGSVSFAAFDADCSLTNRRKKCVSVKQTGDLPFKAQPVEARRGKKCRVDRAFGQFSQPCLQVAAKHHDFNVRSQPFDHRLAAQRTGADHRVLRQLGKRTGLWRQESVANIFSRQKSRQRKAVRQNCRHILGRMNSDINTPVEQRFLDFLGEKTLAANFGQRSVLNAVAGGLDDLDFNCLFRKTVRRHEPVAGLVGLRQCQRTAPCSDTQRI